MVNNSEDNEKESNETGWQSPGLDAQENKCPMCGGPLVIRYGGSGQYGDWDSYCPDCNRLGGV